jgi:catechol 2,3-dioxygenase-like lactoylglutathione lyase family enzyme
MAVECVIPILRVQGLDASVAYYVERLGFRVDWRDVGMVSVSRDGKAIMLCEGAQGHAGTWVWIGVDDASALHDELVARGALIRRPPANFAWALEVHVTDPDGHVLRFGSTTGPEGRYFVLNSSGVSKLKPVAGSSATVFPASPP